MVVIKMFQFLSIFVSFACVLGSIDSDTYIDGLFPPDIDHDWRFNWNAFPNKLPHASKYIQKDPSKYSNKIIQEPERKTFMDFASMLPIPNAEALMAASGVSLLQNVASASMPNIPKMVSSFFNIKNMFNNRNQLLPLLRSREYRILPGQENELRTSGIPRMRRNVTRRFKRPIVVAPLDNTLESDVKVNQTEKTTTAPPLETPEPNSIERHTFVNSDFVGIPSPVGYNTPASPPPIQKSNETVSKKLPPKSRFILKNPLEMTVRTSYRSNGKNLFKSPPVMEEKFFTTSFKDLFQFPTNKEENQKNNNKIVIITDDDLNDSKRPRMMRQRSRGPRPTRAPSPEAHKPPMELPVYIQEQRQMTGMHPPPIQIPNIFLGDEENGEAKSSDNTETKICENRKPKKVTPTKNPVHSSVMDIITNHSRDPPVVNNNNGWTYPTSVTKAPPVTQRPPPPISTMEIINEFDNWNSNNQNNDEWSPNTPPFKPLHPHFTPENVINENPPPLYYTPQSNDQDDDDLEFPAESKKVVRLMMPEIKLPKPAQQFQLQSQTFQKKSPMANPYLGYPGAMGEQNRYPSPHMMLNDGLLYQRYNLLKEIEQMQSNLFGGNNDGMDAMIGNSPMMNPGIPSPMMSSQIIPSPVQSMPPVVNSGPVVFSGNPSPPGPSMKSGTFTQKGKPMKLMKFRVL